MITSSKRDIDGAARANTHYARAHYDMLAALRAHIQHELFLQLNVT